MDFPATITYLGTTSSTNAAKADPTSSENRASAPAQPSRGIYCKNCALASGLGLARRCHHHGHVVEIPKRLLQIPGAVLVPSRTAPPRHACFVARLVAPSTVCRSVAMGSVQPPTKPCHNCRRQRLRCDRSYPHCNKCAASGKECLGYGKLFRWTGAIASRGKLAGRTSSAPVAAGNEHGSERDADLDADIDADIDAEAETEAGTGAPSPVLAVAKVRSRRSSSASPRVSIIPWNGCYGRRMSAGAQVPLPAPLPTSPYIKPSSPWVLADPLFQDLNQSDRFYLTYCAFKSDPVSSF